jgi:hypothetical protein
MRIRHLAILALFSMLNACGASTPPASPPASSEAPPAASAAPASADVPTATDGVDLEKHAEPGFSVLLPKGAKQFNKNVLGGLTQIDFTAPLDPAGMNALEAHVNLGENAGAASLDEAVRSATMIGTKEVLSKKEIGGRFLVVKGIDGTSQWAFLFTKGGMVKCNGPAKYVATLTAMCASFEVH